MKYVGYKLNFKTAVHIGKTSLEDAEISINADTLFSALCHEAVVSGDIDSLVDAAISGKLRFSDLLPYHDNNYYIPKPFIYVESQESSSTVKKKAKKLDFIPADKVTEYLSGELDIEKETALLGEMGEREIITRAAIYEEKDTEPYSVGTFRFADGWGLYVIVGYDDEEYLYLVMDLLISLGFSGIGGKRTSGLGKFELMNAKLPKSMIERIRENDSGGFYETLSAGMCSDEEMEDVCDGARYALLKRGGFVSSYTYSTGMVKKRDMYVFKSGSVFRKTFEGVLKDVSNGGGHPVYRYAKPIFLEVRK